MVTIKDNKLVIMMYKLTYSIMSLLKKHSRKKNDENFNLCISVGYSLSYLGFNIFQGNFRSIFPNGRTAKNFSDNFFNLTD